MDCLLAHALHIKGSFSAGNQNCLFSFGSVVYVGVLRGPVVSVCLEVPAKDQEHAWSANVYLERHTVPHLLNSTALKIQMTYRNDTNDIQKW